MVMESLSFVWFAPGGPSCGVEVLMWVLALAGLGESWLLRRLLVMYVMCIWLLTFLDPLVGVVPVLALDCVGCVCVCVCV